MSRRNDIGCIGHFTNTVSLHFLSVSSLPASTSLSHTTAPQSLVMSPGGVANDNSVTLTLTDTQGMLDGVTLNLNAPVKQLAKRTLWVAAGHPHLSASPFN